MRSTAGCTGAAFVGSTRHLSSWTATVRVCAVPLLMLAAVSGAAACSGGSRPVAPVTQTAASDESGVRDLIQLQGELTRRQDWGALYDTLSPAQQAACPKDRFADLMSRSPGDVTVEDLHMYIYGIHAYVTYSTRVGDRPLGRATSDNPDIYVLLNGRLYDDVDGHSPSCTPPS
jgi:hypothetical protein